MAASLEPGDRLRRSRCLVLRWVDGDLVATNYRRGTDAVLPAPLVDAIHALDEPRPLSELRDGWGFHDDVEALCGELVDAGLLVVAGSEEDRRERRLDETWRWGDEARWLHFATRRQRFTGDPEAERAEMLERVPEDPPPSPFRDRGPVDVPLPPPDRELSESLSSTLERRRTCRDFDATPVDLGTLACLLEWVWGAREVVRDPPLGEHLLKTSPSGGARHPIEVYPLLLRVEGAPAGKYHYDVRRHGLVRIPGALDPELAVRLFAGQRWFADAAALFVMTAVLPRSMWKYPIEHAYRVLHLDAGHLGQTFHLACTALGLGPITSGALDYPLCESELAVDGIREVVLYAGAAGHPSPGATGGRPAG